MTVLLFRCTVNPRHEVRAPRRPERCPAVVKGSPCRGELAPAKRTDLVGGLRWPKAKGAA